MFQMFSKDYVKMLKLILMLGKTMYLMKKNYILKICHVIIVILCHHSINFLFLKSSNQKNLCLLSRSMLKLSLVNYMLKVLLLQWTLYLLILIRKLLLYSYLVRVLIQHGKLFNSPISLISMRDLCINP